MGLLDGKVALITGQAAGNEATVQAVLAAGGETVGAAPVDLTDPAAVERFVGDAVACFSGLDIVYNNAGGPRFEPVDQISVDDWRATIAVELDTVFFVTRHAWPHLVARGGGVILNISSVAGMMGFPQPPMAAHAAAKAGVIGLARQLAVEGAPVGIRAVTLSPGAVLSREGDLDQTQRNAVTDRTLLKRWGRPEEVVEAAVFLASDRASYITGANIPIEGARRLGEASSSSRWRQAARGVSPSRPSTLSLARSISLLSSGWDAMIVFINVFHVDPPNQQRLVDILTRVTAEIVSKAPGFVSSTLHRSTDGNKVTMYAQWATLADYEAMRKDPAPRAYLHEALSFATFDPGMYEVVREFRSKAAKGHSESARSEGP